MKKVAAAAVVMGLLAIPALAQPGGAHGGSGGHATSGIAAHAGGFAGHSGFGGGFSAPHPGGFAPRNSGFAPRIGGPAPRYGGFAPRNGGFRPRGLAPSGFTGPGRTRFSRPPGGFRYRTPYRRYGDGREGNGRSHYGDHHRRGRDRNFDRRRPFYNGFNGLPYAYGYGALPWYGFEIDPGSLGTDWLDDNSDESAQNDNGGNVPAPYPDYGQPGPQYGQPEPGYGGPQGTPYNYAPQQPYSDPGSGSSQPYPALGAAPRRTYTGGSAATGPQQNVEVIFKDGRPPETIHNYMLTATTLTVLDTRYQQIPLNQIDLAATEAFNRALGVNFTVPGATP